LTNARLKSFSVATNSWFILLDDDNTLAPDALHRLRQCLGEHPDLGGICPQIQPIWQSTPPKWVVALGHQVLSYNSTRYSKSANPFDIWKPGVKGARPPGGGMIVHRRAADAFVALAASTKMIRNLGRRGEHLSSGEDFFIYDFLYQLGLPTVYDDSIVLYHQISSQRAQFRYLLRLLYHSNYSFGIIGIMRFGRWNILYSALRGLARLTFEFLKLTWSAPSWRMPVAFVVALCGHWCGTVAGFFDRRCVYLPLRCWQDCAKAN
jgi:GT2 family glycosyltransferase